MTAWPVGKICSSSKDTVMKYIYILLFIGLFFLCSCTMFYSRQPGSTSEVPSSPKPLAMPIGKHWQVIEEAPQLSNDTGRLPFQTEQSLQPDSPRPVKPEDNRRIETIR
jgi:hypothetical protein